MENVFSIKYNSELDRLEIQKERGIIKIKKFIKKHKFFSGICVSFLALCFVNFYLIYSFMKVLESI